MKMNQNVLNVVPVVHKKVNKISTFVFQENSGQHGDSNDINKN